MSHRIYGQKLGRNIKERKALFKNLVNSLILFGKIETTEAKAKAVKGLVDKLVTKAKKRTLASQRQLLTLLPEMSVKKLINEITPRLSDRSSGFTRVIKIGSRLGDRASLVLMEWVEGAQEGEREPKEKLIPKKISKKGKKVEKPDDKTHKR